MPPPMEYRGAPLQKSSAAKPAMNESSAEKPATYGVFAWYNIGWLRSRFRRLRKHEEALASDLGEALEEKCADVSLLCECGEIGVGLGNQWVELVRRCCGPGFHVTHQSNYTSIVRQTTLEVLEGPSLKGPLCRAHGYRMCQHLRVQLKDSAAKPIDLFNVHSPSSRKRPLNATVRQQILAWICENGGSRALFGGDLNSSKPSLETGFKNRRDITYCYEEDHKHSDLVIAKGLPAATSVACDAQATSNAHRMYAVMLKCAMHPPSCAAWPVEASASAAKPAETSAGAEKAADATAEFEAAHATAEFAHDCESDDLSEPEPDLSQC